jgi:succinyl-diaminopimelate desuccinylase
MTFLYMAEHRQELVGELVLALVSDEETGSRWGVKWLLKSVPEFHGDAVLIGEPFSPEFVIFGEKGVLRLEFTAHGKGAHGAYAHLRGVNAIEMMNDFLRDLRGLEAMQVPPHELSHHFVAASDAIDDINGRGAAALLEKITVNVGTISGGYLNNLVPESCKSEVDIRLPLSITTQQILAEIDKICLVHPGVDYVITNPIEPSWTSVSDPIVQSTLRASEYVKGKKIHLSCSIAADDAAYIRPSGIACVRYGPRAHQIGGENEYILVEDLIDTVKVHTLASFDYLEMLE